MGRAEETRTCPSSTRTTSPYAPPRARGRSPSRARAAAARPAVGRPMPRTVLVRRMVAVVARRPRAVRALLRSSARATTRRHENALQGLQPPGLQHRHRVARRPARSSSRALERAATSRRRTLYAQIISYKGTAENSLKQAQELKRAERDDARAAVAADRADAAPRRADQGRRGHPARARRRGRGRRPRDQARSPARTRPSTPPTCCTRARVVPVRSRTRSTDADDQRRDPALGSSCARSRGCRRSYVAAQARSAALHGRGHRRRRHDSNRADRPRPARHRA